MKQFIVKNQFEDVTSGELMAVGSVIEADAEREILLRAADVIGKEVLPEPEPVAKEVDSKDVEAAEKVCDEAGAVDETTQNKAAAKQAKATKDDK